MAKSKNFVIYAKLLGVSKKVLDFLKPTYYTVCISTFGRGQSEDVKGSELEVSLRTENFSSSTRSFFHDNIPEEM